LNLNIGIMFNKLFRLSFLFIFFVELISLCVFLLPELMPAVFFIILALVLFISLYSLEYGLLILLAELFIGSKGYLFFLEIGGINISIRIAFWLIIMAVWLADLFIELYKRKQKPRISNLKNSFFPYFMVLFLFIAWGLVNGFINNNSFNNIFFDFNGWLYFALIFPIYSVIFKNKDCLKKIFTVFAASIIWLSLKTYFLLFIFSHNMIGMIEEVYHWIRVSGVGEITNLQGGFYRIFFQSHIYVLAGFFIFLIFLINQKTKFSSKKLFINNLVIFFTFLSLFLSVVLLSFSRSNWVGLAFGVIIFILFLLYKKEWKKALISVFILISALAVSLCFIIVTVKFPYPDPTGGFSATELLSNRASQLTGEAALSSRWSLLPELWEKIKKAPILGSGFGATITYISSDPRILEADPSGKFTTFAFEWGWLDIWIKLGILGIITYIALIFKIFIIAISKKQKNNESIIIALAISLAVLTIVSFFSPYMNHPLGIGFLMLAAAAIDKNRAVHNKAIIDTERI